MQEFALNAKVKTWLKMDLQKMENSSLFVRRVIEGLLIIILTKHTSPT